MRTFEVTVWDLVYTPKRSVCRRKSGHAFKFIGTGSDLAKIMNEYHEPMKLVECRVI